MNADDRDFWWSFGFVVLAMVMGAAGFGLKMMDFPYFVRVFAVGGFTAFLGLSLYCRFRRVRRER